MNSVIIYLPVDNGFETIVIDDILHVEMSTGPNVYVYRKNPEEGKGGRVVAQFRSAAILGYQVDENVDDSR